jgi:Domain of unknown function (DUF4386)
MHDQNTSDVELSESNKKTIYTIGGLAALLTVLVAFGEMIITFLPGGNSPVETVFDWFAQLQSNWFMGLRNLGLLNIAMFTLGIPMYFALYAAHRRGNKALAALAMIVSFIGVAVFLATNRAFSMLELSAQYAQATTEAQRSMYAAAGQAMLSVGRSHSPGTFISFFLGELAGVLMSIVLLRGQIFSRTTAYIGIIGFTLLSIFEVCTSFIPSLRQLAMLFAIGGGLLNIMWLILLGRRLLQLVHKDE